MLVGFQAAGTRSLSVHADLDELMGSLGSATNQPESVFLVRRDEERSTVLRDCIVRDLDWAAVVPTHLERVRRCALASAG